jgi:hypothetical protein
MQEGGGEWVRYGFALQNSRLRGNDSFVFDNCRYSFDSMRTPWTIAIEKQNAVP